MKTTPVDSKDAVLVRADQLLCLDEYQMRRKVDKSTVARYAKAYRSGAKFGPISVAIVSDRPIVVDGWHRLFAQRALERSQVEAVVVRATKAEALAMAAEANLRHGLPLKRTELLAAFQALIRARRHKVNGRLLSYRELQALMGGQVAHTTLRNWMQAHFPHVARQYSSDGVEGPRDNLRDDNRVAVTLARTASEQILSLLGGVKDPKLRGEAFVFLQRTLDKLKAGGHWEVPEDDF